MSDSLQPHGLQHAKVLCLPLSLSVCSGSCPLSKWWWVPDHRPHLFLRIRKPKVESVGIKEWNLKIWIYFVKSGFVPFPHSFSFLGDGNTQGWHYTHNHHGLLLFLFFAVHITSRTNCITCSIQCKTKNVSPLVQKPGKHCYTIISPSQWCSSSSPRSSPDPTLPVISLQFPPVYDSSSVFCFSWLRHFWTILASYLVDYPSIWVWFSGLCINITEEMHLPFIISAGTWWW